MEALVEVHGKGFEDKKQLLKDTMFLKSKVLLCLQQFGQAKTELKKLKKKDANSVDDDFLDVVLHLSKAEKYLKKCTQCDRKSKLNELIGDKLGELSDLDEKKDTYLLSISNAFYQKALDDDANISNKRKSQLLESMALNYEGLKQFSRAKLAYSESLKAVKGNALQELKMVLELAKLADKAEEPRHSVIKLFQNAVSLSDNLGLEVKAHVLKTWLDYHRANIDQDDVERLTKDLEACLKDGSLPFRVDEVPEVNFSEEVGGDSEEILADVSDEDSTDDNEEDDGKRKLQKFRVTCNMKGESKLHQSCQGPGNIEEIRRLIRMGHPVNLTDNSKYYIILKL